MATFFSFYKPLGSGASTTPDLSATLGATTATAEIVMSKNQLFVINATGDINIILGQAGVKTPTAANFRIPSGTVATYDTGDDSDRIRIFNPGAGSITYWIQFLSRC